MSSLSLSWWPGQRTVVYLSTVSTVIYRQPRVNYSPPAPVEPDELVEPPLIEPETELPPAVIPPDELLPPEVVVVWVTCMLPPRRFARLFMKSFCMSLTVSLQIALNKNVTTTKTFGYFKRWILKTGERHALQTGNVCAKCKRKRGLFNLDN